MTRALVAILGLVIVAGMGISGFQIALHNAGEDFSVTNETWTPNAGTFVSVNKSDVNHVSFGDSVTVRDENDTLMDPGTDYEWNDSDGGIKAIAGGGLDGDANATVSYSYSITTADQRNIASGLALLPDIVGVLLPILGIVVAFRLLGG